MTSLSRARRMAAFFVCFFAYTSIYIARLNLSVASVPLTESGTLSAAQIGVLGTVFSVVYAAGRFFSGELCDRLPPVIPTAVGLSLAAAANLTVGFLPPFYAMAILWGANAIGQSLLWGAMLRSCGALFPPETVKKYASILVTAVSFGNVVGILVSTAAVEAAGLRFAFLLPGFITLAMALLALIFLSPLKADAPAPAENAPKKQNFFASLFSLFKDRMVLGMAIPVFLHGLVKDNVTFFMTMLFSVTYGIDLSSIALFVVFIPLVGLVGRLVYPFLYKIAGENENKVSICAFVCAALCALPLLLGSALPMIPATVCLSVIYAALSVVNTSALSIFPLSYAKEGKVAKVSGLMDLCAYLAAGIGSALYGFLADSVGYTPMMILFAVFSGLGALSTFVLERRAKR